MADFDKVVRGLKRCSAGDCPSVFSKSYAECEYTIGPLCIRDKLLSETIELLNEQRDDLRVLFNRCRALTDGTVCENCGLRGKCTAD